MHDGVNPGGPHANSLEFDVYTGMAIPAHEDIRAPSIDIWARATPRTRVKKEMYSSVAVEGEEGATWYGRVIAFLKTKQSQSEGGDSTRHYVFLKWYWEEEVNQVTKFPRLRWSLDIEEEGAWGICPLDSVLRVVHVVPTWSGLGDFQINLDAML